MVGHRGTARSIKTLQLCTWNGHPRTVDTALCHILGLRYRIFNGGNHLVQTDNLAFNHTSVASSCHANDLNLIWRMDLTNQD